MSSTEVFHILFGHIVSFKLPFRLLAILAILFLTLAVGVLTYRGGVEIWGFFKVEHLASTLPGKFISKMMGWMMAVSTFVQSGPIIWDKLSVWGQALDNLLMKYIFHKTYFLNEVENSLKETRKLINNMNAQVLETSKEITYSKELSRQERENKFGDSLKKAYKNCEKVVKLLKQNDPYDNFNRKRKARADEDLNNCIIQLTDIFQKNHMISTFA